MKRLRFAAGIAAALCALGIFCYFARHGLRAQFLPDDLMNLHRALRLPSSQLVQETLLPWSGAWRPFGFLFYKWLYAIFGFHPLPYHALGLALLVVNMALMAALAWRLTGKGAAAAFTALLVCHHGYFADLYLNSGTLFDVLAAAFCLIALLLYLRNPRPGVGITVLIAALFLLAVQTKEIALFLPAALWAYELTVRRDWRSWREAWCAWLLTVLAAAFAAGLLLHGAGIVENPDYTPRLSPALLLERWGHYLGLMIYQQALRAKTVIAILVLVSTPALLLRDAALRWTWIVMLVSPAPLLLISERSFYAFYIPYLFWALFAAILLARVTRAKLLPSAVVFALLAAFLVSRHAWIQPYSALWHANALEEMRPALQLVPQEAKRWPRGSSVLFLDDPYPENNYTLLYVATLSTGDLSLAVHRVGNGASPAMAADCDFVYRMTRDTLSPAR